MRLSFDRTNIYIIYTHTPHIYIYIKYKYIYIHLLFTYIFVIVMYILFKDYYLLTTYLSTFVPFILVGP